MWGKSQNVSRNREITFSFSFATIHYSPASRGVLLMHFCISLKPVAIIFIIRRNVCWLSLQKKLKLFYIVYGIKSNATHTRATHISPVDFLTMEKSNAKVSIMERNQRVLLLSVENWLRFELLPQWNHGDISPLDCWMTISFH